MNNHNADIRDSLKGEFKRLLWTSFGVFLFILFFQPFPLVMLNENDRLIYVTAFGAIYFLLACLVLVLIPIIWPRWFKISEWETGPPVVLSLLLLGLTSTAFAFYIRYVGKVPISFYIMFKVVLVCLLPIIVLIILYKNKSLERLVELIQVHNKDYFNKTISEQLKEDDKEIELANENKSEKITLKLKNIICIKSADNYFEIYFIQENSVEKKLIRGTLKNIETQLSPQSNFIRCHRTTIVNILFVEKLIRNYGGYNLKMSCFDEKLPVSRQYLIQIRAALSL